MRAFVVAESNNEIVNLIEVDDLSFVPGKNLRLVECDPGYDIGDLHSKVTGFVKKPVVRNVPDEITPYQARMALNQAGLRDTVELALANAPLEVRDAWQYGLTVYRTSPMIAALAASLGLNDAAVDALFIAASQIE